MKLLHFLILLGTAATAFAQRVNYDPGKFVQNLLWVTSAAGVTDGEKAQQDQARCQRQRQIDRFKAARTIRANC